MANSGTINAGRFPSTGLNLYFDWSVTNINNEAGTGTLNYKLYIDGSESIQYRVYGTSDRNYCNLDGNSIYKLTSTGSGTYSSPYPMYCKQGLHNMTPTYASQPDYTFSGYIIKYGILASGSKTIYYDDNGNTSFTVYGAFQCYYGASNDQRIWIRQSSGVPLTITPSKIERFSKSRRTNDSGANWVQDKFVYKTTDYGAHWVKCNLYKTTNGTASSPTWTKIT